MEVKGSSFGLERTWSRTRQNKKPKSDDEVKLLTENLTCPKPFHFGEMQDIFENGNFGTGWTGWRLEITNFLNIMEQDIFGAFCSSFPYDSGLPKNWIRRVKRMGPWKTLKTDWYPQTVTFQDVTMGVLKVTRVKPKMIWTLNNKSAHLSLSHRGKQNLPFAINL